MKLCWKVFLNLSETSMTKLAGVFFAFQFVIPHVSMIQFVSPVLVSKGLCLGASLFELPDKW